MKNNNILEIVTGFLFIFGIPLVITGAITTLTHITTNTNILFLCTFLVLILFMGWLYYNIKN